MNKTDKFIIICSVLALVFYFLYFIICLTTTGICGVFDVLLFSLGPIVVIMILINTFNINVKEILCVEEDASDYMEII